MTKYISSDTNIWIDFSIIDQLPLPFRLDCTYIMFEEAVDKELLKPDNLKQTLLKLGLESVEITIEELIKADEISSKHSRLTKYDCIALAIAKERNILLLTGDGNLRKAAKEERVSFMGTLGLLEELYKNEKINKEEYINCLNLLKENLEKGVRLPEAIIESKIQELLIKK